MSLKKAVSDILKGKALPEGHISTYKDGSKYQKRNGRWVPYADSHSSQKQIDSASNSTSRESIIRSKAFKNWFGDWENDSENASKVVDKDGKPLVVYHGTKGDFSTFDLGKKNTGVASAKFGHWFAFDSEKANIYADNAYNADAASKVQKKMNSPDDMNRLLAKKLGIDYDKLLKKIGNEDDPQFQTILVRNELQNEFIENLELTKELREKYNISGDGNNTVWLGDKKMPLSMAKQIVGNQELEKLQGEGGKATQDDVDDAAYNTGNNIMPVYLNIKNPLFVDSTDASVGENVEYINQMEEGSHDGIIFKDSLYVENPTQIKSAIGNSGSFDPNNPDITKGKALPIGHVSNRKDGKYRKVKATGDATKDWVKIKSKKPKSDKTNRKAQYDPDKVYHIPLSQVRPDPEQPRKEFDAEKLHTLVTSIKKRGLDTPIKVRKDPQGKGFIIVAGERRYRAHKELGKERIKATVGRYKDRKAVLAEQISENVTRAGFTPLEEADAYHDAIKNGFTKDEIAKEVGKSKSYVTDMLRIAYLEPEVKSLLKNGVQHKSTIMVIARHEPAPYIQRYIAKKLSERQYTAPEALNLVRAMKKRFEDSDEGALFGGKLETRHTVEQDLDNVVGKRKKRAARRHLESALGNMRKVAKQMAKADTLEVIPAAIWADLESESKNVDQAIELLRKLQLKINQAKAFKQTGGTVEGYMDKYLTEEQKLKKSIENLGKILDMIKGLWGRDI